MSSRPVNPDFKKLMNQWQQQEKPQPPPKRLPVSPSPIQPVESARDEKVLRRSLSASSMNKPSRVEKSDLTPQQQVEIRFFESSKNCGTALGRMRDLQQIQERLC